MVNLILNNANSNADIDTFLLVKHIQKSGIRLLFKSPKNQFIYFRYGKCTIEIASSASYQDIKDNLTTREKTAVYVFKSQ